MARQRSTTLIGIGVAVFVMGAALAFLGMRSDDDDGGDREVAAEAQPAAQETPAQAEPETVAPPPLAIPDGHEAVAVQVPFVPGVAGYVAAGDQVNVYATVKSREDQPAIAKLVLSNVEVLAAHGPAAGSEGGNTTYVLAVNPTEAERMVFLSTFESYWLAKVRPGVPPVGGTPGQTHDNLL